MIIDASNLILGRMATEVAKKALLGEEIDIVNSEKAVVTGDRKEIFQRYKTRMEIGNPLQGPYFQKIPERLMTIGM